MGEVLKNDNSIHTTQPEACPLAEERRGRGDRLSSSFWAKNQIPLHVEIGGQVSKIYLTVYEWELQE